MNVQRFGEESFTNDWITSPQRKLKLWQKHIDFLKLFISNFYRYLSLFQDDHKNLQLKNEGGCGPGTYVIDQQQVSSRGGGRKAKLLTSHSLQQETTTKGGCLGRHHRPLLRRGNSFEDIEEYLTVYDQEPRNRYLKEVCDIREWP